MKKTSQVHADLTFLPLTGGDLELDGHLEPSQVLCPGALCGSPCGRSSSSLGPCSSVGQSLCPGVWWGVQPAPKRTHSRLPSHHAEVLAAVWFLPGMLPPHCPDLLLAMGWQHWECISAVGLWPGRRLQPTHCLSLPMWWLGRPQFVSLCSHHEGRLHWALCGHLAELSVGQASESFPCALSPALSKCECCSISP